MKTALTMIGLTSLLTAMACSGADPSTALTRGAVGADHGKPAAADADEEEANDKVVCAVDADCDADEVCTDGLCAGLDGDTEDADDDGAADEEEANDKIVCAVDTDCDADEVCTDGLCTGLDGDAEDADDDGADADEEEANDKVVCSVDTDCDADEVCVEGLCQ